MKGSRRTSAPDGYLKALELLAGRDYSREELRRKLARRGVEETSMEDILQRLSSQGLIDDDAFAARWVAAALRSGRGVGPKLLFDLQQKGIPREKAREAVETAMVQTPAEAVLADIVRKRFGAFDPASASPKERQRVYGYLQRRGFPLATIIGYFNCQQTECDS